MAAENKYDLFITDMVMPAMGGDEIVRRIKLDEKTKDIPIIVLSASISDEDAKAIKEMDISDFYEKTKIIPSDLSRKVAKLLS
jgi:CheY-like chemotaxis protein